jgi:hypothetical protein
MRSWIWRNSPVHRELRAPTTSQSRRPSPPRYAGTARDSAECLVLATEPDLDVVRPPTALEPVLTKYRFMTAIGAPRYIPTVFGGGKLEGA